MYREAKERMATENKKMQEKLDKEAADLKKKLQVQCTHRKKEKKAKEKKIKRVNCISLNMGL